MKRALLLALMISIGIWKSTAVAQDFDPKEAIVGAWILDIEPLSTQIAADSDPEMQQMAAMAGGMMLNYVLEIRPDGTILLGGVESPVPYLFEVDDEGLLWMVQKGDGVGSFFNGIRFDGPDRFIMQRNPEKGSQIEIEFVRVFPRGMLEMGVVIPDAAHAIEGFWAVDKGQLESMPWLNAIQDARIRQTILSEAISRTENGLIGFNNGIVYFHSGENDNTDQLGGYTIRSASETMIALSILIDRGPDSESPLLRIVLHDENHIDMLFMQIAPGPIPMVRSKDVPLP